MKKCICKRLLSLLLVAALTVSLFAITAVTANAADGTKTLNGKDADDNSNVAGVCLVTYTNSSCTLDTDIAAYKFTVQKSNTSTVTIKNVSDTWDQKYVIRIRFQPGSTAGPTVTYDTNLDGVEYESSNYFKLKPGKSIVFTLKNTTTSSKFGKLSSTIKAFKESTESRELKVKSSEHGKVNLAYGDTSADITANDGEVTTPIEYETPITLTAVPDEGCSFYGFLIDDTTWVTDTAYSITLRDDKTVSAIFYDTSLPLFRLGSDYYTDLNAANTAAVASDSDKTIVLVNSGTISSAVISEGVSLVIPSVSDSEGVWVEPEAVSEGYKTPTFFRTLTLMPNATLTVKGVLSVNGTMFSASSSGKCGPTGKVGRVILPEGASISLEDSAYMYTWGYVTGEGNVYARDESTVFEEMLIHDFRGGNATFDLYSLNKDARYNFGCFPFTQYYIQNIESRLTISSTAREKVEAYLSVSGAPVAQSAEFFGSNGVFRLSEGTTLVKYYDPDNDKLIVEVNGDAWLGNLHMPIAGMQDTVIDSKDYILPINNMWITQTSGTLTTHYKINLLPDSGLIIREGAKVMVTDDSYIYIYDVDDLGAYNYQGNVHPLAYSPTLGGASPRSTANMLDSFVQVDGEIEIYGSVSTTQNGANVTSTNPRLDTDSYGKIIVHNKNVGLFMGAYQSSNRIVGFEEVPLTAAVLKNSNDTYRPTIARNSMDAEFYYVELPNILDADGNTLSVWVSSEDPDFFYVKWLDKDNNVIQEKTVKNTELALAEYTGPDIMSYTEESNGHITKFYDFVGWIAEYDVDTQTLYYKPRFMPTDAVALSWVDGDTETEITKTYIRKLGYITNADIPIEAINTYSIQNKATAENQYRYKGFTGRANVAGDGRLDIDQSNKGSIRINSNLQLTVTWEAVSVNAVYTVKWQNAVGDVILEKQYFSTQNPVFSGEEPAYTDNTKVFYGWKLNSTTYEKTAALPKPTANQTYTPVFKNACKVTWVNSDGSELASEYYPSGAPTAGVVYPGALPTKAADNQFTYKFIGWDKQNLTTITADTVYTAQYTTFLNTHTVTWLNYNGDQLDVDTMYYGVTPEYAGPAPVKEAVGEQTFTFNGWDPEISVLTHDITYTAVFTDNQYKFEKQSISLDGYIGVNFYFSMPEFNGQKIRFTFRGKTETVSVKDKGASDAYYKATFKVSAPEMTDPIKAEILTASGSPVAEKTYCVADYIATYTESGNTLVNCYIVGDIMGQDLWPNNGNWDDKAKATYQMYVDPDNTSQYIIRDVELKAGDQVKAYEDGKYYGDHTNWNNNATATESGVYTIYCFYEDGAENGKHISLVRQEKDQANHVNIVSLLRSMDRYGNLALQYFSTEPVEIVDHIGRIPNYPELTSQTLDILADFAENIKEVDFDSVGLAYYGSSMLLDSGTVLRHYFRVDNKAVFSNYKDTVEFGGKSVQTNWYMGTEDSGYVYFDLEVPAAELDEPKQITIGEVTARFSALDYVMRALVKDETENTADSAKLAKLVTALYWYNVFADEYFD